MTTVKKLMILGAGIYQVPLIKKAREAGLETIVVSVDGPYPGFALADKIYKLDTRDHEGILKAAVSEGIDGIVTTGTDVAVRAIGVVCDELGLPGISRRSAALMTDKAAMKKAFRDGGVHTSEFRLLSLTGNDIPAEAERCAEEIGYPVMVKACDVSGSRGITKVTEGSRLEEAIKRASEATHTDHLIIEKVNPGYEIGLDGFVIGGRPVLCLPHTKYIGRSEATTVPVGHGFPFKGSDRLHAAIEKEFEAIVKACSLTDGAVNADVFVISEDEVSVIEAGGRAGATTIPELITINTGIDYYGAMIRCALGEPVDMTPRQNVPCIGQLLLSPVDGVIRSIDEDAIEALRSDEVSIELDYGVGDRVRAMRNGTDRIGQIIMKTGSEEAVGAVRTRVLQAIRIERSASV